MLPLILRAVGGFVARNKTTTAVAANYTFGFFQDGNNVRPDPNRKVITDSKPVFDTSKYGVTREIPQHILLRNKSLQKMVDSEWSYLTNHSSVLRGLVK